MHCARPTSATRNRKGTRVSTPAESSGCWRGPRASRSTWSIRRRSSGKSGDYRSAPRQAHLATLQNIRPSHRRARAQAARPAARRGHGDARTAPGARCGVQLDSRQPSPTEVPMRLIGLAVVLAGSILLAPVAAEAQKSEKMARVGILGIGPVPSPQDLAKSVSTNPFWMSMRQLGWVDGQNMVVERRFGESADQLRTGAADLVRLKVDVLFVSSAGLAKILQLETKTIPIVIGRADEDLVAAGLVDSLPRPGGNITGSQLLNDDLIPKRLELLKALVPNLSKVALLREDVTTSVLPQIRVRDGEEIAIAARSLGIEVHTFTVRRGGDLAAAFLGMKKNHNQGVVVMSPAFMFVHRKAVIDLAAAHRIAAIYELRVFVDPGGLMSYGVNASEMQRRAAVYVDKILKGAKPADLPVEQPTKFELVINLKTAKALGLTIPPSVLLRADQVIE